MWVVSGISENHSAFIFRSYKWVHWLICLIVKIKAWHFCDTRNHSRSGIFSYTRRLESSSVYVFKLNTNLNLQGNSCFDPNFKKSNLELLFEHCSEAVTKCSSWKVWQASNVFFSFHLYMCSVSRTDAVVLEYLLGIMFVCFIHFCCFVPPAILCHCAPLG
jgi:hypothetical protein